MGGKKNSDPTVCTASHQPHGLEASTMYDRSSNMLKNAKGVFNLSVSKLDGKNTLGVSFHWPEQKSRCQIIEKHLPYDCAVINYNTATAASI